MKLLPLMITSLALTFSTMVKASDKDFPCTYGDAGTDPKDYAREWEKADSLQYAGLPQSAFEIVNYIYKDAKATQNSPQFLKAIIYKICLRSTFEDEYLITSIDSLNYELKTSQGNISNILHSMLAGLYQTYYNNVRWQIAQRTQTINFKKEDLSTWGNRDFISVIISEYMKSLEHPETLKKTDLKNFDPILSVSDNSKLFRPTLYDFLAHRALDYFSTSEAGISEPVNKFVMRDADYLASSEIFVAKKIESPDSLSLNFFAARLYQDLVAFHLSDPDPRALIDVEIKRLAFFRQNGSMQKKEALEIETLKKLEAKYQSSPYSTDLSYALANRYNATASAYAPLGDTTAKWDLKTAMDYCNEAIRRYPNSDGAKNCEVLRTGILLNEIGINVENASLPKQAFRALVQYKNTPTIYLRIIKIDPEKNKNLLEKFSGEDLIQEYLKMKADTAWSQQLPDDGDLQRHSAEIKMPALPIGFYIVLAADNKDFSYTDHIISYNSFWITNISFISRRKDSGAMDFYVLDRNSGLPMKNVQVKAYSRDYNYTTRKYEYNKYKTFVSNENGYFEIPPNNSPRYEYKYFHADFQLDNDQFSSNSYFYQYPLPEQEETVDLVSTYFLDRMIYRPGQTIYFKGLITERKGDAYSIKPNQTVTVELYDVNYQVVARQTLISNEYGTIDGSFTAPSTGLTGQMHISDDYGTVYFSVEEYKRPKFEVMMEAVKGTFKLNDTIHASGIAKAYAGNAIDGASVSYRIVRSTRFPYWGSWLGWYYPDAPSAEIAHGTTTTDDMGRYKFEFVTSPDENVDPRYQAVFDYTLYADVTDINGETHTATSWLSVGTIALLLDAGIPGTLDKKEKNEYPVYTTNFSGQTEHCSVNIKIWQLKTPSRVFRDRLWSQPDRYTMDRETYYKLFPNDLYANENDQTKFEKGELVLNTDMNTALDSVLEMNTGKWTSGIYMLSITSVDKYGTPVECRKYFTLFGDADKSIPDNSAQWIHNYDYSAEPGTKASLLYGTAFKNTKVLFEIELNGKITKSEWLSFDNSMQRIEIPVLEEYRGNFVYHLVFVKNNRVCRQDMTITVPHTDKMLDMEFATFRDKLQPGQQEEWKIVIKGPGGEKVAAEMLAGMYDASLDAYRSNSWYVDFLSYRWGTLNWTDSYAFTTKSPDQYSLKTIKEPEGVIRNYDGMLWFGIGSGGGCGSGMGPGKGEGRYSKKPSVNKVSGGDFRAADENQGDLKVTESTTVTTGWNADQTQSIDGAFAELPAAPPSGTGGINGKNDPGPNVQIRTNFNETAFFYPHLMTNEKGEIVIKFTVPEALTKWKFMGFAHTKDLKTGSIIKEAVTQKDLMVVPNAPRFFRENDKISFSAKISNISDKNLSGEVSLHFFDAVSMKPLDALMNLQQPSVTFATEAGKSTAVVWEVSIPEGISAITYRIVAKAGNFSDGEEDAIPVLTNRMLVTESLPLWVNGVQTKDFSFDKLINSGQSSTLRQYKLTLEFTSNPAWYAIQALPYMMEYPYECSEQIFNRYYANSIASHIAGSSPRIKQVFDSWRNFTPDAFLSSLEKNQELKNLMLEETPWVMNAQNETERKQRVALLFDLNTMSNELQKAIIKLSKKQSPNGGWSWFEGMPDDRYITQYILCGFGHLDHLGVKSVHEDDQVNEMIESAVKYGDERMTEDYRDIKRYYASTINENHLSSIQIQYMYARSFFIDQSMDDKTKDAWNYFLGQAKKYRNEFDLYSQGMIALVLYRYDDKAGAEAIVKSLKEKSLHSPEMGMYWRDLRPGYYWYQAPVETMSLLIECFDEITNDQQSVEEMKIWLLKQKQTQDWKTTKATADACYALLLEGADRLSSTTPVIVSMGNENINPLNIDAVKVEAGTGYFKTSWSGSDIKPEMGKIKVSKSDEGVAWGAVYWQYFEQLDKITPAATPLSLSKTLFRVKNTDSGPVMEPITESTGLKVGDKIKVRIELRSDRDMDYVHMKDMRASGFEPVNVISQYKFQDGLGYYESTKDASTNFFFDHLNKGTYVFEYTLFVTHAGDFSNGVSSIECMYAPEFSAHSEGIRVKVTK
jgi:hypothetical protein